MALSEDQLRRLAEQLCGGDQNAARQWRKTFNGHLTRIVRRSLRQEGSKIRLAQRILALARAMQADFPFPLSEARERQIHRLAEQICDGVVEKLRKKPSQKVDPCRETLREW